jgi:hypothetical protein
MPDRKKLYFMYTPHNSFPMFMGGTPQKAGPARPGHRDSYNREPFSAPGARLRARRRKARPSVHAARLRIVDRERIIAAIVEDPGCHFTAAPKWTVTDGFAVAHNVGNSLFCCRRDEAARAHRVPGRLWHWFPASGRFRIGFVLVDNEGSPFSFDFSIQQQPRFRVETSRQDGLRHIYFTAEAFDLEFAQTFELRFAGDGTPQAVEGLVFLPPPLGRSLARFPAPRAVSSRRRPVAARPADRIAELRLLNPAGLRLDHELLRFPLPPGMADLRGVRLGRTTLPFHLRRIGRDPRQPNLQLEVLVASASDRACRLALQRGRAGKSPRLAPLRCQVSPTAASIQGRWRLRIRDGQRLEVAREGDKEPLTLAPALEGSSGPWRIRRSALRLVYASPLVAEVECRFALADPADDAAEIVHGTLLRFVRDADRIDLEHLIEVHSPRDFVFLKRYGARFSPAARPSALSAGGGRALVAGFDAFQHTDRDAERSVPGLPRGFAPLDHAVSAGGWQLTVQDFARAAPIRLRWRDNGLDLDLLPDAAAVRLDPDAEYRFRNQFFLEGGRYKLRAGMARRHASSLAWTGTHEPARVRAEALRLDRPPCLHAPLAWDGCRLVSRPVFARQARFCRAAAAWLRQWQENEAVTRPWNFFGAGDWFGERIHHWGNNEYDTPLGALQMFLATGDPEWRTRGLAAARHLVDVDTIHGDRPHRGWQIAHSLAHGGGYFPNEFRVGAKNAGVGVAHVWVEGMLLHHWLTGDERSRAAAVRLLDDLAGPALRNWRLGYERDAGWHLIHLSAGAAILQEDRYLKAAARLVGGILERQRSDGSFRRVLASDHCDCYPKHTGCVSFMLGILLAGLRRFHLLTGDPAVADALVRTARFLVQDMWDERSRSFRYTSCPRSKRLEPVQMLEGLIYAARLARDRAALARWTREYRALLQERFPRAMVRHERILGDNVFGKALSQRLRLLAPAGCNQG